MDVHIPIWLLLMTFGGIATLSGWFGTLFFGFSETGGDKWNGPLVIGTLAFGLLGLITGVIGVYLGLIS